MKNLQRLTPLHVIPFKKNRCVYSRLPLWPFRISNPNSLVRWNIPVAYMLALTPQHRAHCSQCPGQCRRVASPFLCFPKLEREGLGKRNGMSYMPPLLPCHSVDVLLCVAPGNGPTGARGPPQISLVGAGGSRESRI